MQAAESANPSMSAKDGSNNALHSANAPPKKANITASPVSNEATAVSNAKATTSVTAPSTSLGNTSNLTTTGNGVPVTTVSEAATNAETDDEAIRNQKLVEEFQYLLEKSQSLFSGLRDLPPTGSHRQWRPYFEKTFEVYTKLWKFQQTHRSILENKSNYGLKRWEVGEIASKIGQLYYHYYLRTSETNYLHEAYVFYEAIHERQYFKDILEVKNSALMVKKMRYYARFIIVCFLLNKDENVRQLIAELEGLIEEYAKCFKPPDAKEWQLVLEEIVTFTEAEKKLVPINLDRTPGKIEHRLPAVIPERNIGAGIPKLKLQEAILVGNYDKQLKFSELTLDMYRMLQSLEREPSTSHPSVAATTSKVDAASSNKKDTTTSSKEDAFNTSTAKAAFSSSNAVNVSNAAEKSVRRSNPHKYLLYRPSLSQLMVYISTAFKDTNDNSALFLYLSADGYSNDTEQVIPGYRGGVLTSARTINKGSTASERTVANNPTSNQPSTTTGGIGTASSSTTTTTNNNNSTSAAGSNSNATSSVITNNNTSAQNNNVGGSTSTSNSINNTAATAGTTATAIGSGRNMEHSIHPPSAHCLHPADLIPFTRKPLFLIVDSEKSTQFRNMPNVFDQPVMCLMSPVEYPSSVQDKCEIGSLFTLFLHTPVLGFCSISDIGNLDQQKWDECVRKISAMEKTIGDQLLVDSNVDTNIKRFMSDDFLYYFIVRFVLCGIFLRYHSSFKDEKSFPSSLPHLPETIYVSTDIVTMLAELTAIADVGTYFSLPTYATVSVTANVSSTSPPPAPASVSSNTNNNTGGSVGMPSSPPLNAAAPTDF